MKSSSASSPTCATTTAYGASPGAATTAKAACDHGCSLGSRSSGTSAGFAVFLLTSYFSVVRLCLFLFGGMELVRRVMLSYRSRRGLPRCRPCRLPCPRAVTTSSSSSSSLWHPCRSTCGTSNLMRTTTTAGLAASTAASATSTTCTSNWSNSI